ncbi:Oligopeptide-binding protein OppA [Nocardioides aquaticus]|uniref:Oligopeptide-binding protein OppA n=1 Tax=Nocardioides aquaticus TaxID=160826 RepID=A0ABX8EMR8_9ACTN|nr:ABC transporter substrate-binding protein [Nocardioides aquaticus]QVT80378.1 Oligopeptide-binding protein OppA [Nocardioides aquaticus]
MRFKKPFIALTSVSLLSLAACGGSGDGPTTGSENVDRENLANTGDATDPERQGPVEIDGATEGGTVDVLSVNGANSLDPSEAYYTNTSSILQGLVTRSLTQLVYDAESGQQVLVPDLATDLGTSNEDFTEWTFTIRDDVTYENGDPITPEDIKFGMLRSMDRAAFPEGPAFSNDYFEGGAEYEGPYTGGSTDFDAIQVDGQDITIQMATPFPDMPYWGTFPAMGPIPEGPESNPAKYAQRPLASGPYKFDEYNPERSLTLVRNEEWDPNTDPGRTQYPDEYVFDFQRDSAQIDEIILNDSGDGQSTLTYDNVQASNYPTFQSDAADRLVEGGAPCTYYLAPDYRKIESKEIREALAWAYPYEDATTAAGYIIDVTRIIDATNLMPPGIPGREEYNPIPEHEPGTTDAERAAQILEEAGETGFELKFLFANDDPNAVAAKDVLVRAFEDAGFTASPQATTLAELSTVRADPDADINLRTAGWCSDWPSGGSWFPPTLQSTNLNAEGLGSNYAVFSEQDVDDRIQEILGSPIEDQPGLWNELDQYIAEEYMPVIPYSYTGTAMAHGSAIEGMQVDQNLGMPTWKDMWVNQG